MSKIDGLEIVMTKHIKSEIDKELKKRFEELKPDIAKRYEELLNMRNMETDQFNDGFNDARAGKLETDHPHYELDTDNWRLGYAWGMFEPMKERLEAQETIAEIQKMALEDKKNKRWTHYGCGRAPELNKRYLVKLSNDWVTCATYLYSGSSVCSPFWWWKDDNGNEIISVKYWKGLEE